MLLAAILQKAPTVYPRDMSGSGKQPCSGSSATSGEYDQHASLII